MAEFAREVRNMMFADPTWTDERRRAMRTWLTDSEIRLDQRTFRPVELLADEQLARRALAELQKETG